MPQIRSLAIKRGTVVEFVGAAHPDHLLFKERQVKEFFEKYGLQVGDRGKIWEGYRGSWIRITWILQDGTTAYRVPMRSGNFKIVDVPVPIDLVEEDETGNQPLMPTDADDRDYDELILENNDEPVLEDPVNILYSLRKVLKGTRIDNLSLAEDNKRLKETIFGMESTISALTSVNTNCDEQLLIIQELLSKRVEQVDHLKTKCDEYFKENKSLKQDVEVGEKKYRVASNASTELAYTCTELRKDLYKVRQQELVGNQPHTESNTHDFEVKLKETKDIVDKYRDVIAVQQNILITVSNKLSSQGQRIAVLEEKNELYDAAQTLLSLSGENEWQLTDEDS